MYPCSEGSDTICHEKMGLNFCCAYVQGTGGSGYDVTILGYLCVDPTTLVNGQYSTSSYSFSAVCAGASYLFVSSILAMIVMVFMIWGLVWLK